MKKKYIEKSINYTTPEISDINEIEDMLESGLDYSEIAKELGISKSELDKVQREIYTD